MKIETTCLTPPNCTNGLGNWNGGFSMYSLTLTEKFLNPLGGVGTTLKNDRKAFSKIGSGLFDSIPVKYFSGFSASYCSTSTPTTKYSPSYIKKRIKIYEKSRYIICTAYRLNWKDSEINCLIFWCSVLSISFHKIIIKRIHYYCYQYTAESTSESFISS